MVHKARDGTSSSIDNHVLVKVHQIVALHRLSYSSKKKKKKREGERERKKKSEKDTYLVLLVRRPHTLLTFGLSDDFSRVFHNDLVWFKCAVTANTVSAIWRFDNLNTNIVLPSGLSSLLELVEATVTTIAAQAAIAVVAFVEHVAVLAVFVAAGVCGTHAFR